MTDFVTEPITSMQELNRRLLELQKAGVHLITPFVIQEIPAKHVPVLIPVPVDPNPLKDDVYKLAGGKFALGRNPLRRIEQALGIDWDVRPGMTGRVDNGSNPDYIHYRAIGHCPMPDGTKKTIIGEKEIRVDLFREESVEKYRKKAVSYQQDSKDGPEFRQSFPTPDAVDGWVQEKARHDILQLKKHLLPRASTGAKCIAVKSLGVRESYTSDELAQPFLVLKIQARLDMNDPEDAALIRAQALGMVETLYSGRLQLPVRETPALEYQASPDPVSHVGHSPSATLLPPPAPVPLTQPTTPATAAPPVMQPQPSAPIPTPPPLTKEEVFECDFKALSVEEQARELEALVKRTDPAKANAYTASRLVRWSDRARLNFYKEQAKKLQNVGAA